MKQTFVLPNSLSDLVPLLDRLDSLLFAEGVLTELVKEIRLIAEEGISNIINYAYDDGKQHQIEVTLNIEENEIHLELKDGGKQFDPTEMPQPKLRRSSDVQTEGGMGVHLMKTLADEVSYAREGGYNILRLKKRY